MKIVFMGTPDFAVPSLNKLIEVGHEICAVFTQTDKPKGRGNKMAFSPVKETALTHGIPIYQPFSLKKQLDEFLPVIKSLTPDAIVVVAYGKILPMEILNLPKYGCINVHGSLLPKYRGAAPIQWTVLNGDRFGGVTTMLMAEGIDTGDMLLSRSVEIGQTETASELYSRLSFVGADLLIETIDLLENGELTPVPQNDNEASYAPMLSKEMSRIDFSKSAEEIKNQIQGLSDWPCAVFYLDDARMKVYRCEISDVPDEYTPGEIVNEKDFTVACGVGALKFLEVQAEGSKRMNALDYLRGKPIKKGTVLS